MRRRLSQTAQAVGPNVLVPEEVRRGLFWILEKGLSDPMALLLIAAGVTYAVVGKALDAVIAFAAVIPVVAVGLVLEARAENALDKLRETTRPRATVLRNGRFTEILATEIVRGDVVSVKEGDIVPADGRVIETRQLSVDESPLTGESFPVEKIAAGTPLADSSASQLKAGSVVLAGHGLFIVEAVGADTEYGKLARAVAHSKPEATPLQRAIRRLVLQLGAVAAIFCASVTSLELLYGHGIVSAVTAGVSLGIAAVPEEFPVVFTLYLSLGAWRLSRHRALVRRLTSVEALGSTTVICADKTGTLTEGKLSVAEVWSVTGSVGRVLEAAMFACEPDPFDPLERAIFEHAEKMSVDTARVRRETLVVDYPFDPCSKYMSHVWRINGRYVTFAKGSPETILTLARVGEKTRADAEEFALRLAGKGMRVLAIAAGPASDNPGERGVDESQLDLLGVVAFADTPRQGVSSAIEQCKRAGIRVMMITGDHPMTATAIAEGLGLLDSASRQTEVGPGGVLSVAVGDELDSASEEEFDRIVKQAVVLARIRPEQKFSIVRHLKVQGEIVAMTGDGINDAPALKEADIGVAMGMRGTEVARASADLILLDDNFATIVSAIAHGRRIFDNLSKAVSYLVAFHIPLLLAALVVPLARVPLLLLPLHLVLLEIVLHPTVSLAFENEPPSHDLMSRPPRNPKANLASVDRLVRPVIAGSILFMVMTGVYIIAHAKGIAVEEARTMAFSTLIAGDIAILLAELCPEEFFWRAGARYNPVLLPLLVGMITVLLIAVYSPVGRVLQMKAVPLWELAAYGLAGFLAVAVTEPLKRWSIQQRHNDKN
ncbi:MAG: hypothetical protein C4317_09105 [Acidimicrobiia bacterium]